VHEVICKVNNVKMYYFSRRKMDIFAIIASTVEKLVLALGSNIFCKLVTDWDE